MREQKSFYTAAAFHTHPSGRQREQPPGLDAFFDSFLFFFAMQYPGNRAKNCIFPGAKNLIISVSLICLRLKLKKNCGPFKYSLDRSNSYGKHSTFCRLSLCSVHKWIDFTGKGLRTREIYSNNWKKKKSRLHSNKIKSNKHFVHFNKDEQKG